MLQRSLSAIFRKKLLSKSRSIFSRVHFSFGFFGNRLVFLISKCGNNRIDTASIFKTCHIVVIFLINHQRAYVPVPRSILLKLKINFHWYNYNTFQVSTDASTLNVLQKLLQRRIPTVEKYIRLWHIIK